MYAERTRGRKMSDGFRSIYYTKEAPCSTTSHRLQNSVVFGNTKWAFMRKNTAQNINSSFHDEHHHSCDANLFTTVMIGHDITSGSSIELMGIMS
ncbi:hypothetical protein NPIL_235391 [Nephila pilipes]|uniref:Uncharacterized protein n=1 Tax=Nephila pilipes TaxID=299642 RepID=A0A8X6NYK2_NEPPI|nr:hypothetical protein NPIL_235391 [Nephila pilipes]